MIKRIVKLSFHREHTAAFKSIFEKHRLKMLEQNICDSLELLEDINAPGIFFTISTWKSEQDLEDYRASEYFNEIWSTVKPWFNEKAEAWSLVKPVF